MEEAGREGRGDMTLTTNDQHGWLVSGVVIGKLQQQQQQLSQTTRQ